MPRLLAMLSHGVLGLTKAAMDAEPVGEETLSDRRRACAVCPSATRTRHLGRIDLTVLTPASTCGVCRCHIHAKTRLAGEVCPLGKW